MSEGKEKIINGIDLSKYFKNHYDSWGRLYCIEYKGNPLELQNDIKRLQEENEELKSRNANLRLNLATYDLPEVKKVLTDWRTGELDKKFKKLQKENEELKKQLEFSRTHKTVLDAERIKYKQALEEIRKIVEPIKENTCFGMNCGAVDWILNEINEALNDRD